MYKINSKSNKKHEGFPEIAVNQVQLRPDLSGKSMKRRFISGLRMKSSKFH